ncbi:MAG TPA: hypothetical protein VGG63_09535 [Steroidobacteraceae bacterium]|jgi:hypothetical protein
MSGSGLPSLLDRHWAESVLAIGAVIIAAVSLWVGFDSERTNRELVASASWPFVGFYSSGSESDQSAVLTFQLTNQGIGPAKLESFELFWRGRAQHSPWELLQNCCARGETAGQPGSMQALIHDPGLLAESDEGIVVRAGETIPILTYTRTAANAQIWNAFSSQFVGNLSARYCYCSVFNECWLISARFGTQRDLNPPRVRACPRPEVRYDNIR